MVFLWKNYLSNRKAKKKKLAGSISKKSSNLVENLKRKSKRLFNNIIDEKVVEKKVEDKKIVDKKKSFNLISCLKKTDALWIRLRKIIILL